MAPPSGGSVASRSGWRALGLFWVVVAAAIGVGVVVLERLGPPPVAPRIAAVLHLAVPKLVVAPAAPKPSVPAKLAVPAKPAVALAKPPAPVAPASAPAPAPAPAPAAAASVPVAPTPALPTPVPAALSTPPAAPAAPASVPAPAVGQGPVAAAAPSVVPIAAPIPALAEPDAAHPGHSLPRIGPSGLAPMAAYAAHFDAADRHPKVALLLAGIGLDQATSLKAIRVLPAAVSLAISPYASDPARLLAAARTAGHEYLISLPLEPARYPLNDPGPRALLTSATAEDNRLALDWALSRFPGYVGATGALGTSDGERFAGSLEDMAPVMRALARRGLLYVDPRAGAARLPFAWGRAADVAIDIDADPGAIAAALDRLDAIAARRGAALGVVAAPGPVMLGLLAAWIHGLPARGLTLAPASAVALPPPPPGPEMTAP
ncbi:MAG: divergent polysaccharide deacetylase family protein [Rhodospirillales bacterium]|nr:divergent polysaccharide deacetylase family protein [Rhodospirillales bacterium]